MGLKSLAAQPFAKVVTNQIRKEVSEAEKYQRHTMHKLLHFGKRTSFAKDHYFKDIEDYDDFKAAVPIRDYEGLRPYIDRVLAGEKNVIWFEPPIYFCKTSGTTSGAKYIPLSKAGMKNQVNAARNALLFYIHETGKTDFINGKMMFLQGSPKLDTTKIDIPVGRLSGLVHHHVPNYLLKNRMPSFETNCIEDWETKLQRIIAETADQNLTVLGGIPPWVLMYFDRLLESTKKEKVAEVFENLGLYVHGGVNFRPYRQSLIDIIGKPIDFIETYPASEGFIAFQDSQTEEGLLLNINAGLFFEFIPADEFYNENPTRLSIEQVELHVNYALILNTDSGLWGYSIGDTVKFVSLSPARIVVTGRIAHFISAFGEHVIAEEIEQSLMSIAEVMEVKVSEFTVAPQINPVGGGTPYHQWFVEFKKEPDNLAFMEQKVDEVLQSKNIYYRDLRKGNVLKQLEIVKIPRNGFQAYMDSVGKLGGQNKIQRLSNDRKLADVLLKQIGLAV